MSAAGTFHLQAFCSARSSVGVEDEPREGAVFVAVAPMSFAPIQFDENLITCIQMKYDTVAGIVITLVLVLGNSTGSDLE